MAENEGPDFVAESPPSKSAIPLIHVAGIRPHPPREINNLNHVVPRPKCVHVVINVKSPKYPLLSAKATCPVVDACNKNNGVDGEGRTKKSRKLVAFGG